LELVLLGISELHGLWHIFSALACYIEIVNTLYVYERLKETSKRIYLDYFFCFPIVIKK
jgi:hypothetical protein